MWSEGIAAGTLMLALAAPALADYAQAPFHARAYEIADTALGALSAEAPASVPAGDPGFAAAVAAFLLLSERGLAEAYEEAVETGAQDDYAEAHGLLQAARPWIAAAGQDGEIDGLVAELDALMPTPERPARLDPDPEAAEGIAQGLVGALERVADADLYLGRDLARAIETVAALAAQGCAPETDARPRRAEIAAIYFEDALEAPLSVLAAQEADEIEEGLEALREGELSACEDTAAAFAAARRGLFP